MTFFAASCAQALMLPVTTGNALAQSSPVCLNFEQTTDMDMEFIKAEVFGVEGGAPIMAKDHPALQELFKLNAGELCSKTLSATTFICRREV